MRLDNKYKGYSGVVRLVHAFACLLKPIFLVFKINFKLIHIQKQINALNHFIRQKSCCFSKKKRKKIL